VSATDIQPSVDPINAPVKVPESSSANEVKSMRVPQSIQLSLIAQQSDVTRSEPRDSELETCQFSIDKRKLPKQ